MWVKESDVYLETAGAEMTLELGVIYGMNYISSRYVPHFGLTLNRKLHRRKKQKRARTGRR